MGLAISRLLLARQASEAERQAVIRGGLAIALAVMATNRRDNWLRKLAATYALNFESRRRWYESLMHNIAMCL